MLKPEDAEKVLTKDLANVIRKSQQGKPLTAAERALIQQTAAGGQVSGGNSAFAKTYEDLAQRLGLTRKTLQNASKRYPEEAPRPRADGRHDVAAWSEFVVVKNIARAAEHIAHAASIESEEEGPVTVTDWKAEELKLKCAKLEIENGKVAGELVAAADVEAGLSTMVAAFRQALNNFGPRLAQKVLNVADYHEAEEIVQGEINVLLRTLQNCDFLNEHAPDTVQTASPVVRAPAEVACELPDHKPKTRKAAKPQPKAPKKAAKKTAKKKGTKR